ncbi:tyrosine-type recombinase/integrase [Sphingomonas panni]
MATVTKRRWTHNGTAREAWTVRWSDGRARRAKTFKLKKEADAYRRKVETEMATGVFIPAADSRTFEAATALFLREIDARAEIGAIRPCTARNYHSAFRQAILPALGKRLVLDTKAEHLEEWYYELIRTGRMEPASAFRRLWFIGAMFTFAVRRGWCRDNPAEAAMKALGRPKQNKIETFSLDEVRAVITESDQRRYRGRERPFEATRLAVALAAFCGLRWGEIHGLRVCDIDVGERCLTIRRSLDGLGNLQEPKTKAGIRDVPLPRHIAQMLADYMRRWPSDDPDGVILVADTGGRMRHSNFRQYQWLPLLRRADVGTASGQPLHFHALRHFAVSWMIENGWTITDVSKIIGHASVNITLQVYAHVVKGRTQTAEAMDNLADNLLSTVKITENYAPLRDAQETQRLLTH